MRGTIITINHHVEQSYQVALLIPAKLDTRPSTRPHTHVIKTPWSGDKDVRNVTCARVI
jgi:hypothetical protein